MQRWLCNDWSSRFSEYQQTIFQTCRPIDGCIELSAVGIWCRATLCWCTVKMENIINLIITPPDGTKFGMHIIQSMTNDTLFCCYGCSWQVITASSHRCIAVGSTVTTAARIWLAVTCCNISVMFLSVLAYLYILAISFCFQLVSESFTEYFLIQVYCSRSTMCMWVSNDNCWMK